MGMGTRSMKNYRYLLIFIVLVGMGGEKISLTGVPTSQDGGAILFGCHSNGVFFLCLYLKVLLSLQRERDGNGFCIS